MVVLEIKQVRDWDADCNPPLPSPSPSPKSAPALVLSNSGKRMDQTGKKKYVKQVTGRHNDTELHLAAQRGDPAAVRLIISDIDAQMTGTACGADFDAEIAEIPSAVVDEANEVGETALFVAADRGFLDVVVELLKYSDRVGLGRKNRSGYDAFHVAAREGHLGIGEDDYPEEYGPGAYVGGVPVLEDEIFPEE